MTSFGTLRLNTTSLVALANDTAVSLETGIPATLMGIFLILPMTNPLCNVLKPYRLVRHGQQYGRSSDKEVLLFLPRRKS
jgi:hypothetical protein